jgi:hypothetical protein
MKGYDDLTVHGDILIDLPFYEGVGTITRDQAKPHHQDVDLVLTPTWDTVAASGLGVISFDGTTHEYLELAGANCADLNFMAGDYSIGAWVNWGNGLDDDQTVIARYLNDNNGWELYFYDGGGADRILTLRHHHAATLVGGNPRTACYSEDWDYNTWWFIGISRSGILAQHYRNGAAITTACSAGGLVDPETCVQDLVIGIRGTKDANHLCGSQWRPRIWDRALSAAEWLRIFESERDLFGV